MVLDGEAEHVPGVKPSVLVYFPEEQRVLVCILDVDKLARLPHQSRYALTHFDPNSLLPTTTAYTPCNPSCALTSSGRLLSNIVATSSS